MRLLHATRRTAKAVGFGVTTLGALTAGAISLGVLASALAIVARTIG